ncbi:hypothetical protein [Hymenobacter sp. GOD-10R]|uniref:hypothetical protein n=1 Tax=Hymenobacter sp. GOD-10R TaxID=3093922 RepID=UPI002D765058|nr:hypothetical protein [Hymenobacter sp. GOD-10R]WRQ31053.1 hypothetical protein SD425_12365 [Hymenobacter sp. GOD-10R]
MSLRTAFSITALLVATWSALPAQAQYGYYRRPARRVVVVRPMPRPVYVAPAPGVVVPLRPVVVAPAPVIVRPRLVYVRRPRPVVVYRRY